MTWNKIIWNQFGAAIDMLDDAIQACPDALWQARLYNEREVQPEFAEFWYLAYHALFWLDFYLSETAVNFAPPAPFNLSELEAGLLPERVFTKDELLGYLGYGRTKCQNRIEATTDFTAPQRVRTDWPEMSIGEMLLYNMRHVQEHAAQLSLFLGQQAVLTSGWISKAKKDQK
ncbi:MAG: hypothetical protein DHS20C20_20780 [Ardenticatenaceae bacterium]|nr:MAG: hypothetical protein DHS20C20_20780 [Ardenticatenaceae bacterium]